MTAEQGLFVDHFASLQDRLPGHKKLRTQAMVRFESLGLPTTRNEDWRFTRVNALADIPFEPATPRIDIRSPALRIEKLSDAPGSDAFLGRIAAFEREPFIALNTALWQNGVLIRIPDGQILEQPIYLDIEPGAGATPAYFPRVLVIAGKNSQAAIVERHSGEGQYLNTSVTEITLGENAVLDHYKIQEESLAAFHIGATQVRQERGSNFRSHYVSLGGRLVRNEVRIEFTGEGGEATLNGLYLAQGTQHVDNFTVIDHAKPHCASHELYKGILSDKAHGVFNGKIFVRQDAQKTDAKQTNKCLLLSDDAVINTKPQLEIFADDVRCTHGATVGQLDATALFYLRSRGIGLDTARNILINAFANDLLERIKIESLRQRLAELLTTRRLSLNEIVA